MAQDDREDRYAGDGSTPEEDAGQIRYDGPVRAPRRPRSRRGGGLPFATAGVLAAAVVILVGVAWLLSGDDDPPPPPPETSIGARAEVEEPPEGLAEAEEPTTGGARDEDPPAPAPVSVAAAEPPARSTSPAREPAPEPSPPPSPSPPATRGAGAGGIGELARGGDVAGACREGNALAQQAARQGHYTVQVLSVSDPAGVRRAFDRVRDERLVVISVPSPRGEVYRLLWGFYPSVEAARAAAASCPDYFPRGSSWPYTPAVATALTPIRR
jgi:hypothetical protein